MKAHIETLLQQALERLVAAGTVEACHLPAFNLRRCSTEGHGDFSCNLALVLAGSSAMPARDLAAALVALLPESARIDRVAVAGPGFINFFLKRCAYTDVLATIVSQGDTFGTSALGVGRDILVVSCLDRVALASGVDAARRLVCGAVVANLLESTGVTVVRELLVDSGCRVGESRLCSLSDLHAFAADVQPLGARFDRLALRDSQGRRVAIAEKDTGRQTYSDSSLQRGRVQTDPADWISCTQDAGLSEEILRQAGETSSIDSSVHEQWHRVVLVSGADARLPEQYRCLWQSQLPETVIGVQRAELSQRGDASESSPRQCADEMITLLLDEIDQDVIRFTFAMRKPAHRLYFDLDLADRRDRRNALYSVQLAYSLTSSVTRQFRQRGMDTDMAAGLAASHRLHESDDSGLMKLLAIYPELVQRSAAEHNPQLVTRYLRDLADGLHKYYSAHKVFVEDGELRQARWCLLMAVRQVMGNGLALLNVSTPEVM